MRFIYAPKLTENVAMEVCGYAEIPKSQIMLCADLNVQHKGDHRGIFFRFNLIFISFEFNVYDVRHEEEIKAGIV